MEQITTIGLDLAKRVFQVHGVDAAGAVVVRRALRRRQVLAFFAQLPPCLVGDRSMCDGALLGARDRQAGSDVRLIAPAYAKAYVRRNGTEQEQERPGSCRGDPRGGEPVVDAFCCNQDRGTAGSGRYWPCCTDRPLAARGWTV
jgi:hypothetical protein